MIPDEVLYVLMTQLVEATTRAVQGNWEEGFQQLLDGRATALQVLQEGIAWGEELVRQYEDALDQYLRRHGPPWEPW